MPYACMSEHVPLCASVIQMELPCFSIYNLMHYNL